MKLFQKLLVAPAALGLLAPAAVNASELNIDGVSDYATTGEQVTSITQFSDVYPTDWAYQALSNLIERYGCVAGYPNGTYRGNRAMTRFEAAALLNACLDRITEVTDELKRLMKEFEKELAILKGRVDGLEARVGELEATQFSTTTKLKGQTTFMVGASSFSGTASNTQALVNGDVVRGYPSEWIPKTLQNAEVSPPSGQPGVPPIVSRTRDTAVLMNTHLGGTVFNYDQQIDVATSFSGKDLLLVKLRAGNFQNSVFGFTASSGVGAPFVNQFDSPTYATPSGMEAAFEEGSVANAIVLDRLLYQFSLGNDFTITVGGRVRQDDMLAIWPSVYPAETILDFFTFAGAPGAYNMNLGPGAGLWWQRDGFSFSAQYISTTGASSNVVDGGLATDGASSTATLQLGYTNDGWGLATAYTVSSEDWGSVYQGNGTPLATAVGLLGQTHSVGVSGWWQPQESGWMPSISVGWGLNTTSGRNNSTLLGYRFDSATTQSWSVGLEWTDALIKGNSAGLAVGQQAFVTALGLSGSRHPFLEGVRGFRSASATETSLVRDGQYAWEGWYRFQVTDAIAVTPALFYLSRPLGGLTQGVSLSQFGAVVKTSFKF